jgi:hypothetical protein
MKWLIVYLNMAGAMPQGMVETLHAFDTLPDCNAARRAQIEAHSVIRAAFPNSACVAVSPKMLSDAALKAWR